MIVTILSSAMLWMEFGSVAAAEKITWTFEPETGLLTLSGTGDMPNYNGYSNVPWNAHRNEITKVVIEQGITRIGNYAFSTTPNLTEAEIPEGVVSIGIAAFGYCDNLTSVSLPGSLEKIDLASFGKNPKMTAIEVAPESPYFSSVEGVLFNKDQTILVAYPAGKEDQIYSIPETVSVIDTYAFYYCENIVGLGIPAAVTDIRAYGLSYTSNLAHIIYGGTEEMWNSILCGTGWKQGLAANVPGGAATLTYVGTMEETYSGDCGEGVSWHLDITTGVLNIAGDGTMYDYTEVSAPWRRFRGFITSVTIQEGVTTVGDYAFESCTSLLSVSLPSTIKSIGTGSFYGCVYLSLITLPSGITSIGAKAFYSCVRLSMLYLPSGLTRIEKETFYACMSMKNIYLPANITTIGDRAFAYCNGLETLYYSGRKAQWNQITKGTDWDMNAGAETTAGTYMFKCAPDAETSGTCGNKLTWNFDTATGKLTISGTGAMYNFSLINVSWSAWEEYIKEVEIKSGVTTVGSYAFYSCSLLERVTIPEGVTSIGAWAFASCDSLKEVNLPSTVKTLDVASFATSESLKKVTLPEGLTVIPNYAFSGCIALDDINIPVGLKTIGEDAFVGTALTEVVLPEGVTSISARAFWNMKNLRSFTIHKGVTTIGNRAFEDCTALENIYYKGNEQKWEQITKNENWDTGAGSETTSGCYHVIFLNDPDITGNCGENITWEYWETEQRLRISGSGAMPDWTTDVPAPWYEYRSNIKDLTISSGITAVGDYAFYNGRLTKVSLPQGIARIGNYAFYGNAFAELSLPEGLTTIGEYAFYGCRSITELVLPEGLTSLEQYAFARCYGLTSVAIPKTVTRIASSPFGWCSDLGDIYYSGNNVEWYEIPKNTQWDFGIGTYTLHYGEPNQYSGSCGENLTWMFSPEEHLLTITGTGEMFDWKSDQLPGWHCYAKEIQTVEIKEGVTYIGNYAFYKQTALTAVHIPESVTKLGTSSFAYSTLLNDIYYGGCQRDWNAITKTNGWDGQTGGGTETGRYTLHYGKENSYSGTFGDGFSWTYWEERTLLEINGSGPMPDWIGSYNTPWRMYQSSLTKVILDPKITTIGNYAFRDCSKLTEVDLPDGITVIGNYAFGGCSKLTEIDLPEGITTIGTYAFNNSGITNINLPQSLTEIGNYAFGNCYSLADVYYSGGKIELQLILGAVVFSQAGTSTENKSCTFHYGKDYSTGTCGEKLTWICREEQGVLEIIGEGAMDNWPSASSAPWCSEMANITTIQLSEKITTIGDYAFYNGAKVVELNLPEGITEIGRYAFYGFDSITELHIPKGVTAIGTYAFYDCAALTAVHIPDSVTFMGEKSLGACRYLDDIYYEGNSREWNAIISNSGAKPYDNLTGYWTEDEKYTIHYGRSIDYYTGSCGENLTWTFWVETGLLEIKGEGAMDDWSYSQPWSTYKAKIQKVTIDDDVTTIGDHAFYECTALKEINIPEGLSSVGNYAFYGCREIAELTIPESVTNIGNYAFYGCNGLTEYHVPEGMTYIGSGAFGNCQYLSDVYFSGNNQDWAKIAPGSPFDSNTGSLTTNGAYTLHFGEPRYYTGTCGENLVWELREGENILRITGSGDMEDWNSFALVPWYNYKSLIDAVEIGPEVTSIGNNAFWNYSKLVEITIPQSVTKIGEESFCYCSKLKKVSFQGAVINIQEDAFSMCQALEEIVLPEGTERIGDGAFSDCDALKSVYLPESLTRIGASAFEYCEALADIYYAGSRVDFEAITKGSKWDYCAGRATTKGVYTLHIGKTEIISGECGENLTWTYQVEEKLLTITGTGPMDVWAAASEVPWNEYRSSIEKVVMGEDVTTVGDYAFLNCYNLAEITIPQKLTRIGKKAFSSCHALSEFTIPETVTELGDYCFWVCKNLTEITIPSGVTVIPDEAFNGCSALAEVNLHDGILSIGAYAFSQNSSLRELEIPSKVTFIGSYAFEQSGIRKIVIPEGVTSIGEKTFYKCNALTSVQLPETITEIGEYAFESCNELKEIKIPEKLKVINNYVFKDCASLKEVEIPKGVTRIGIGGFYGSGIERIYIPSTVTSIGSGAFASCLHLSDICFGGSETKWKSMNPSNMVDSITGYYTTTGTYTVHYNYGSVHNVSFVDYDGTVLKLQQVPHGEAATPPDDPVREGYTFNGWSKTFDNVTDDMTIMAYYTAKTYLVTFLNWNGTTLKTQTVRHGEGATAPSNPTRTGYIFTGWDKTFSNITETLTVTAQFEAAIYTVTFKDWDGTILKTETVGYGGSVIAPANPTRENYVFAGWSANFSNVTANLTVVAQYDRESYFGVFGDGFTWTYWTTTNTLIVTGNGDMPAWTSPGQAPWYSYRLKITAVEIGEGITSISDNAFTYYSSMRELKLPKSLKRIGRRTFYYCTGLKEVKLPAGIAELGDMAFGMCSNLQFIYYRGNQEKWDQVSIETNSIYTRTQIVFCSYEIGLLGETVSVYMNTTDEIVLAVASYHEGRLVDFKQMTVTGSCEYELGSAGLNLSLDSGYTVKAFLWSDTNTCDPLCESKKTRIP